MNTVMVSIDTIVTRQNDQNVSVKKKTPSQLFLWVSANFTWPFRLRSPTVKVLVILATVTFTCHECQQWKFSNYDWTRL